MRARKIAGSVLIVTGAILLILRFFLITGEVEFWTGKAKTETRASGQILVRARERYAERIKQNIQGESFKEEGEQGEQEAALGVAYLLGMKEGLDKETTEMLKLVGLMHLVVASGTHLGILTEIVRKLFGRFSRFSGAFFSIVFIVLFGEMIGWTASIFRASIVAILGVLGWYFGIELNKGKVLGFAAWLTLMVRPSFLFELGWQLSFLAFFGMMVVGPRLIETFYPKKRDYGRGGEMKGLFPEPFVLTEMLITNIGVTICVAPLLIYKFGYFSLASLVGNLLIAPTLAGVMGVAFLAGMPGVVGVGAGWVTEKALWVHLAVIKFFAEKPYFLVQIPAGDARVFLGFMPLLIWLFVGDFIRAQKRRRITEKIRQKPEKYLRWRM